VQSLSDVDAIGVAIMVMKNRMFCLLQKCLICREQNCVIEDAKIKSVVRSAYLPSSVQFGKNLGPRSHDTCATGWPVSSRSSTQ
jgi:hypothetical protein